MNPIRLYPASKDYLWGGERLKSLFHKTAEISPLAESWELSFHKDGESALADGTPITEAYPLSAFGKNVEDFPFFPALIKFIDAKENLSVQVHPSDEYALTREGSYGKTEMWYIAEADEGAGIYLGLKQNCSAFAFALAIRENRLLDLLNFYPVKKGECYFIPSGTIHAIAKGCLIAEIQQNSNLTYRVYDYGRVDKNGKPRELHIDKALQVANLDAFVNNSLHIPSSDGEIIGVSKYFTVTKSSIDGEKTLVIDAASFCHVLCVDGVGTLDGEALRAGDSMLLAAGDYESKLIGNMT